MKESTFRENRGNALRVLAVSTLALSVFAGAASALADSSGEAGLPKGCIPIYPKSFRGWPEAYVLHNPHVHAVVVPAVSRMVFLAKSPGDPNILRLDSVLADAGAIPPDAGFARGFFNLGGDWAWPVVQTNWPALSPEGTDWPPPPLLADAPSDVLAWTDSSGCQHVRLTRHYPAPVSATLSREFTLPSQEGAYDLHCEQTLVRDPDSSGDATFPLAIWHVTQVVNPHQLLVPIPHTVVFGNCPDDFSGHAHIYRPKAGHEVKFASPGRQVALAHTPAGSLMVKTDNRAAHVEIYSNPDIGYAELETIAPEPASPGITLSSTLTYHPGSAGPDKHNPPN